MANGQTTGEIRTNNSLPQSGFHSNCSCACIDSSMLYMPLSSLAKQIKKRYALKIIAMYQTSLVCYYSKYFIFITFNLHWRKTAILLPLFTYRTNPLDGPSQVVTVTEGNVYAVGIFAKLLNDNGKYQTIVLSANFLMVAGKCVIWTNQP